MGFFDKFKMGEKRSEETNKKIRSWSLIIIAAVLIIGCYTSFRNTAGTKKEEVIGYFNENRDMFELVAARGMEKKNGIGKLTCEGCNSVTYYLTDHEMVQFTMSQTNGISAYTTHKGVYYSEDDVPMAFQGIYLYELHEDGDGWSWSYDGGCSYKYKGYTEKIDDKWYYFEAVYR